MVRTEHYDYLGQERGKIACVRTAEMFSKRPFVGEKIWGSEINGILDSEGIDMIVGVRNKMLCRLGFEGSGDVMLVQVKSSLHNENCFPTDKHKHHIFSAKYKNHIFVLNGYDDEGLMMASVVAQCVIGGHKFAGMKPFQTLDVIKNVGCDGEAVKAFWRLKNKLVREKWYGKLLVSVMM